MALFDGAEQEFGRRLRAYRKKQEADSAGYG